MLSTLALACMLALPTAAAASPPVIFQEDFEQAASLWQPYHKDSPQAAITIELDAAEGNRFLQIRCPGNRRLEGAQTTIGKIEPLTFYTVRAKVRGKGNLFPCLLSGNGWIYARDVVSLSARWQEVSIPKLTGPADTSLSIYFITRDAEAATFEIDSLEVVRRPDPAACDALPDPVRIEAEELMPRADQIISDPAAAGGKAVQMPNRHTLPDIPLPATSKAAFVYLRLKPGSQGDRGDLLATLDGYAHSLATANVAGDAGWQWVRFAVPRGAAARGSVQVRWIQPDGDHPPALLDSVVVAGEGQLSPERLDAVPSPDHRRPLVAAGCSHAAPVIDGKTDDACWRQCVTIEDFSLVRQGTAPTQKTVARVCYDANRLYIAFRCREYVLQPEANQLHAFLQSQTERDSPVWSDDSVVVILRPTEEGPCYDLFVNARGTVADARCQGADLWSSRDAGWNGDIQAAGRIGDGYWEVELSIRLASFGDAAHQPGQRWGLALGRIEKNVGETSSWNPVQSGFHEADCFGTLLFLPTVGGAAASLPEQIRGRENRVEVERADGAPPLLARLAIETPESAPRRLQSLVPPSGKVDLVFEAPQEPNLTLRYDLLDAGTLRPLYLSPPLRQTVAASDAVLWLATGGAYSVFLNGTRLAVGAGGDGSRPIRVPLAGGVNAFSFQVESGTLAAAIELPGQRLVSDTTWRIAGSEPKDFASAKLDDSSWAKVEVIGDAPAALAKRGAKRIGGSGPAVIRRTVLLDHTYLWPQPDPAQHVPQNAPQHLTFSATGLQGRRLKDFALHLAVPPQFEVIGSTGYYGRSVENKARFVTSGPTPEVRDGREVLVYTISATQPIPYRSKVDILELFNVLVRYRGPEELADEYRFEFWTEAEEGSLSQCPQSFPVRVTPPLEGKQPQRFVWQLWGSSYSTMDDVAMKEATLATARLAGFNNMVAGSLEDTQLGEKYGMANTMGINFEPWSLGRADYLRAHPDDALVDFRGERSKRYVCTGVLLSHGWNDVARALREKIAARRPQVVDWDYESPPLESYLSCYCPRCLEAFRQHAGLPAAAELSPEKIRECHWEPWIDFMTTRNAEVAARFCQVARESGAVFSMYSGYQSRDTRHRYGVDWRKIGRAGAADHVGCGYGRNRELIDATSEALQGIPLTVGILMHPYDRNLRLPVLPLSKARVLRAAADATGGILVYDRMPLAGRSWWALAEVSRLVGAYEDLFLQGTAAADLVAIEAAEEADCAVKRHADTALVLLMNPRRTDKTYRIAWKSDRVQEVVRYYGGASLDPAAPAEITLSPGDAEALVLKLH